MSTFSYDSSNPLAPILDLLSKNAGDLDSASQTIQTLQQQVSSLANQLNQSNDDLNKTRQALQDAQGQLAQVQQALQQTTANDQAAIGGLQGQVSSLQSQLADAQSQIIPAWKITAQKVVAEAQMADNLGVPYVFGGESYQGMDCSGMVQECFRTVGISLPRVSANQATQGTEVPYDQADIGDDIAFAIDSAKPGVVSHIGIYMGGGKMIHTNTPSEGIHVTDVSTGFWHNNIKTIRRIIPR